jgi:hypothetical protein
MIMPASWCFNNGPGTAGLSGLGSNLSTVGSVGGGMGALLGSGSPLSDRYDPHNPGNVGGQNYRCGKKVPSGITPPDTTPKQDMRPCALTGNHGNNGAINIWCPDCMGANSQGSNAQMSLTPVLSDVMLA